MNHPPLTDPQRRMVEANLGLVNWVITRHFSHLNGDEDAFQDGVAGLMRATTDYDPRRGRFSTYAVNWIRSEIGNGIGRLDGINARRANANGGTWQPPLSLDWVPAGGDQEPMATWIPDPGDDPADLALEHVTLGAYTDAVNRLAGDTDLERDIARRLLAQARGAHVEPWETVAHRHGRHRDRVRRRGLELRAAALAQIRTRVPA